MWDKELGPMKWPAINLKMQIGNAVLVGWDNSVNSRCRRAVKTVRLDCTGDFWANRSCHGHGVGGAETVRQINRLGRDIKGNAVGAHMLCPVLCLGAGHQKKTVGVLNRS